MEAHPDNSHEDLRLDMPFPGLIEYMNNVDLDSLDKHVSTIMFALICITLYIIFHIHLFIYTRKPIQPTIQYS